MKKALRSKSLLSASVIVLNLSRLGSPCRIKNKPFGFLRPNGFI